MDENPKILYQKIIMEHSRNPVHYEKRPEAEYVIEAYNPLCGDQFKLFLEFGENNRIASISFYGYGCAISKASTSILVNKLEGMDTKEALEWIKRLEELILKEPAPDAEADEELEALALTRQFPARIQCATLSWEALGKFLQQRRKN